MAAPQFNNNTWYSLQNLGTQYFLGCNSISICGADTNDLTNFELFQVNPVANGSSHVIRPKSRDVDDNGQPFCINIVGGQPFLELCNNESAVWGTGYWNGNDAGDGIYFFDMQQGDSDRLLVSEEGTWSFPDYNDTPTSSLDLMRWSMSSRADINNQTYSTIPAVIVTSGIVPTTTTMDSSSASSLVSSSASSPASSSDGSEPSSALSMPNTVIITQSASNLTSTSGAPFSSDMSTSSSVESPSTTVIVETPTVTATSSQSSARTSSEPSTTPALMSNSGAPSSNVYTAGALITMFITPQLLTWLL